MNLENFASRPLSDVHSALRDVILDYGNEGNEIKSFWMDNILVGELEPSFWQDILDELYYRSSSLGIIREETSFVGYPNELVVVYPPDISIESAAKYLIDQVWVALSEGRVPSSAFIQRPDGDYRIDPIRETYEFIDYE
jgi:hypothetical protein